MADAAANRPSALPDASSSSGADAAVPNLEARYQLVLDRGSAMVRSKQFARAGEVLGRLLEMCTKAFGDQLSINLAPVYFAYGNALLEQVQEATAGAAEASDDEPPSASGSATAAETTTSATAEAPTASSVPAPAASSSSSFSSPPSASVPDAPAPTGLDLDAEDIAEILEIAWECLDSARVVYSKHSEGDGPNAKANRRALATVHCRLGEHQLLAGHDAEGIDDLMSCLRLRKALMSDDEREIADVNMLISGAFLKLANEGTTDNTASAKLAVAMDHHVAAFASLAKYSCKCLRAMGEAGVTVAEAVEQWWARQPASKGLAIAESSSMTETASSSESSSPSTSGDRVVLITEAAGLLGAAKMGSEASAAQARQMLHLLDEMKDRLDEIVDGNEAVARQLATRKQAESAQTGKRLRDAVEEEPPAATSTEPPADVPGDAEPSKKTKPAE